VDLSRQLAASLWAHKSLREAEAALAGTPLPDRVFATAAGEPIRDDAFPRDVWARISSEPVGSDSDAFDPDVSDLAHPLPDQELRKDAANESADGGKT